MYLFIYLFAVSPRRCTHIFFQSFSVLSVYLNVVPSNCACCFGFKFNSPHHCSNNAHHTKRTTFCNPAHNLKSTLLRGFHFCHTVSLPSPQVDTLLGTSFFREKKSFQNTPLSYVCFSTPFTKRAPAAHRKRDPSAASKEFYILDFPKKSLSHTGTNRAPVRQIFNFFTSTVLLLFISALSYRS